MTAIEGNLIKTIGAVLDLHRMETSTTCGAVSIPVVHHHAKETDVRPGPKRVLRCSNQDGHEGKHKDGVCCWTLQTFEDWQVSHRITKTRDVCTTCRTQWPCDTVKAIQEASA